MEKIIMDKESFEKFQKDLEELEQKLADKRKYKGEVAIFQGDNWHDNPTLYQTESEERSLMVQLLKMREKMKAIQIVENNGVETSIELGDIANILITEGDLEPELLTIKLVAYRGDISDDIIEISAESPLGISVKGKHVGDISKYEVDGTVFVVKILEKVSNLIDDDPKVKTI